MSLSSVRIGGFAGLAFVAVVGTANIILGSAHQPQPGASRAEVLDFFSSSGSVVALASAVAPLAWICLVLFGAGVVAAVRQRTDARGDAWPLVGLGATIMQNAVFSGVVACQIALAGGELSPDVAWGLWQLHNALFILNGVSLALIMVSLSVAGLRTGLIRRWHGRVGLVAGGAMATSAVLAPISVDGGPVALAGFGAFALWIVWIATYGVALLRASRVDTSQRPEVAVAA